MTCVTRSIKQSDEKRHQSISGNLADTVPSVYRGVSSVYRDVFAASSTAASAHRGAYGETRNCSVFNGTALQRRASADAGSGNHGAAAKRQQHRAYSGCAVRIYRQRNISAISVA